MATIDVTRPPSLWRLFNRVARSEAAGGKYRPHARNPELAPERSRTWRFPRGLALTIRPGTDGEARLAILAEELTLNSNNQE